MSSQAIIVSLLTWLSALYIKLRGPCEVLSNRTPLVFKKRYPADLNQLTIPDEYHLIAVCYQTCHRQRYRRWYMWDRVHHTYTVLVTIIDAEGEKLDIPMMHFPELCWRVFSRTTYPHHCAIEACAAKVYSVLNAMASVRA